MKAMRILLLLTVLFFAPLYADAVTGDLHYLVKEWVGKYPVEGNKYFLKVPEVQQSLLKLIGQKQLNRLTNLEKEPYYLDSPIDYVDRHLILDFVPNGHYNKEAIRILIIVRISNSSIHVAFVEDGKPVIWKHSRDKDVPIKILKMLDLQNQTRP